MDRPVVVVDADRRCAIDLSERWEMAKARKYHHLADTDKLGGLTDGVSGLRIGILVIKNSDAVTMALLSSLVSRRRNKQQSNMIICFLTC